MNFLYQIKTNHLFVNPTKCMFATNKLNAICMVLLATIKTREIIKLLKLAIGKNGFYFPYTWGLGDHESKLKIILLRKILIIV
jgi:hypothetical protein